MADTLSDPGILRSVSVSNAAAATAAATRATAGADRARETAEQFEAMFISQLLEHMSTGITAEVPFGGGHAEETWRSMLNSEYGKIMARRGGVGIADSVYREILKLQEGQQ